MMLNFQRKTSLGKALSALSLSAVTLLALGCGGTGVPDSVISDAVNNGGNIGGVTVGGGGAPVPSGASALANKDFIIKPAVFGNSGAASQGSPSSTRGSGTTREPAVSRIAAKFGGNIGGADTKNQGTGGGGTGSGSNGNDIVDLNGNNLATAGLNKPIAANLRFLSEGSNEVLGTVSFVGSTSNVDIGGKSLGAGQNLVTEITAGGVTTRAVVPANFFANGGAFGFNVVLGNNGSMVVEIFPDAVAPIGKSDNGSRIIVDTAVDRFRDGNTSTVARLETPDGMVFFDANLDGNFGAPEDACILFDSNNDGVIDGKDLPVAYAIDPNLDGIMNEGETRLIGNNIPEDFINGLNIGFAPANPVGNGLSTVTLGIEFLSAPDGSPIGSAIELSVELISGTFNQEAGENALPRWVQNGQATLQRTLDPNNSNVSLFANGSLRLLEALRMPVLTTAGELAVTLRYVQSDRPEGVTTTKIIPIKKNEAPTLSRVEFVGTRPFGQASGLEALSQNARVVGGNPVRLTGANFTTDPLHLPMVTFGGVTAQVTAVTGNGTVIDTFVPNGAQSGKIAVLQNGIGAQTSQPFIVAGDALQVVSVAPRDGATNVVVDSSITIRFSQPISPEGVDDGFRVETDLGVPIPGNTVVSEDGLTLTHTPNGMLPASTSIIVTLTGALRSVTGIHYDADVSDVEVPSAGIKTVVSTFTSGATAATDMVAPTLDLLLTELIAPTISNPNFMITMPFSEAIAAGTLFTSPVANSGDSLRLRSNETGNLVNIAVDSISENGDIITLKVLGPILGRKGYTLELGPTITDLVGNPISGATTKGFSTALRIDRLSSVSGPIGTRLLVEGSTFDSMLANVEVTFAGALGRIPAIVIEASETGIEIEVPADAIDGAIEISVAGESALSPIPFTVTSAGFVARTIAESIGAFGIAIDVNGRGMVSYQGSGSIGFIDVPSEREIPVSPSMAKLAIGGVPTAAVLNRAGTLGFTTNFGSPSVVGESVFVIDMASRTVLATIRVGRRPTRLAVSPDDRRLYVTNNLDDTVSVVDLSSLLVVGEVAVGAGPNGVAISPDNRKGYVCNYLEETVTVFDTTTLNVLGTVVVGKSPARVMISPDASRIFVTNNVSNTITVIEASTLAILQTISGFSGPSAMVFDPNGERFFVTNRVSNTIQEVVKNQSGGWMLGEIRIATASVPAGCVITSDGSLLAYTTEGAGKVFVVTIGNPRMTITSLRLDENDGPGRSTLTVDGGKAIWVTGRGFGASRSSLIVRLNGQNVNTFDTGFNAGQIKVLIPSNATSGPLTVSRNRDGLDIVSNDISLLITGRIPQVISATPGDGSRGVARDTTVVLELSEPLDLQTIYAADGSLQLGATGLPVLRVVQLDDDGGSPKNMSGTWTIDEFGRRLEFSRPIDPLTNMREPFFTPESNNVYEIVVSPRVRDLFGNNVVGTATSFGSSIDTQLGASVTAGRDAFSLGFRGRFVTEDERGPRIQRALYRDPNGDGPSAGDEIEIEFDEELLFVEGNFAAGIEMLGSILFTNGSPGGSMIARPGSNPRSILVTLGTGAQIDFAAGGTTLNAVSATEVASISAFTDYSKQRPTAGKQVRVEVDPRYDNGQSPRLLFAFWEDTNTSTSVDAGDHIVLDFSEAIGLGAAANIPALFNITNGDLSGAMILPQVAGEDRRRLRIVLGGASSFTPGLSVLSLIDAGNGVVSGNTIFDYVGKAAHAGQASEVVISATLPTDAMLDGAANPLHIDVAGTASGLSEGDVIIVAFTAPIRLNLSAADAEPSKRFRLGVNGDRFGSGARLEQPAYVTPRGQAPRLIAPNEIVIRLGKQPVLTLSGVFGVDITLN